MERVTRVYRRLTPDAEPGDRPAVLPLMQPVVVTGDGGLCVAEKLVSRSVSESAIFFAIAQARAFAASEGEAAERNRDADREALDALLRHEGSGAAAFEYLAHLERCFATSRSERSALTERWRALEQALFGSGKLPDGPAGTPPWSTRVRSTPRVPFSDFVRRKVVRSEKTASRSAAFVERLRAEGLLDVRDSFAALRLRRVYERIAPHGGTTGIEPILYRSSEVRAFTLPDGSILVSTRLVQRAASDGAIAFVLAHELAHHELGHFRDVYRDDRILDGIPFGEAVTVLAHTIRTLTHGKRGEARADERALERILAAGYSEAAAQHMLSSFPADDEEDPSLTHPSRRARRHGIRAHVEALRRDAGEAIPTPTDRTWLCAPCRLRHCGPTCPECTKESFDLTNPLRRVQALRALRAVAVSAEEAEQAEGPAPWIAVAILSACVALLVVVPASLWPAVILVSALLLLDWMARKGRSPWVLWVRRFFGPLRARSIPVRLAPTDLDDSGTAVTVGGVTSCAKPLTAPLTGRPCIAWRVRGTSRFGPVDDSAYTAFAVDDPRLGPVVVPRGSAAIAFLESRAGTAQRSGGKMPWLRSWVLDAEAEDLTETIIEVGERARVTGPARRALGPATYRSKSREAVEWVPGARLAISAIESAEPTARESARAA